MLLLCQVFGTDVMVTVAKSFDAPIKCECACYSDVYIIVIIMRNSDGTIGSTRKGSGCF